MANNRLSGVLPYIKKNYRFFIAVFVVVGLILLNFIVSENKKTNSKPSPSPTSSSIGESTPLPTGKIEENQFGNLNTENWTQYKGSSLPIDFKYPSGVRIEDRGIDELSITSSNQSNADMEDGIFVVFHKLAYDGKTLNEIVNQSAASFQSPPGELILRPRSFNISGKNGYLLRGIGVLGPVTEMYVPLDSSDYLLIINSSTGESNQSFVSQADALIKSLQIK